MGASNESALEGASMSGAQGEFTSRRERRAAEQAQQGRATRHGSRRVERVASDASDVVKPASTGRKLGTRSVAKRPASQPRAKRSKRTIIGQLASLGAMTGVFALLVSTSVPATAFYTADDLATAASAVENPQSAAALAAVPAQDVMVNVEAAVAAEKTETVTRDSYEAKSFQQQIAALRGNPNFSYSNNPNGSIQWPFVGSVPISSGFGPRNVCSYCSSYHLGIDFTPGSGVPIQAMADGVVSAVNLHSGGLGNHVIIDHVINGQRVTTVYAHMQWGSIQVATGQQVTVGTVVGAVGNTGTSTGAHLHFEVHLDGTPVDPYVWLKANAN
ncbi:MAG: M23 family metallopeptidase [Salinibacterium sp.]|nr:M23 family metallopeptidase [Salinibacterium sp.]MBF0672092.1 M23 family metallopeptidase [Salinibacterium sp.]